MLEGIARKIGLVIAGVTFIPWLLVVIGFALITVDIGASPTGSIYYPHWTISLEGLPLIALACVHAVVSTPAGAAKFLRVITTFMSVIFLLSLGMVLYQTGNALVAGFTGIHGFNLLFAGSLLGTLTWTAQMVVWTFYEDPASLST